MFPTHVNSRTVCTLAFLLFSVLGGCRERPRAPALRDGPVYHCPQEGFRFLVPDGWTQNASAVLPTGRLEGENFLVRYRMKTPEQGATLQIVCWQDSASLDLEQHHASPSYGVQQWKLAEPSETIQVNSVPARRIVYTDTADKRPMTKEVVCFRQNDRVYAFVGLFSSRDEKAREQIRRAVASVLWER
jgi:hypothetical protein